MEYPVYLIAFLLVMAPASAICISLIDDRALGRYESMITEYDQRVSSLERQIDDFKPQQTTETRAQSQLPLETIAPLLEPQSMVNILDILTRNLPKKDPALMALSASDSCTDMLTASFISIASITFNLLKFAIFHMDVVLDFVIRLASYTLSAIAGYVTSGRLLRQMPALMGAVVALIPALITILPNVCSIAIELFTYLPQILMYLSTIVRNMDTFFIAFS
jgi:hypothetical protein